MKVVLVPVAAIFGAIAACCCCGDFASELEGMGIDVPSTGGDDIDIDINVDGADAGSQAAPSGGGGEMVAGTCGAFKEMGLKAPTGMSVMVCSEGGGADSIVLTGSNDPGDACKTVKASAEGAGWATEFDTNSMGTFAITMKKGTERMSIGCTAMTGSTTVSMSISPAY